MINKSILFILLSCLFSVTTGLIIFSKSGGKLLATENVKIQKDGDGIWRIRDNEGYNKGKMVLQRNDKINWQAHGSAMEFRFHENVNDYFTYDDGLFEDGKTQMVDDNKKLRITLKNNAPRDTLVYDVYVVEADTFVVGNSPPVLIVR